MNKKIASTESTCPSCGKPIDKLRAGSVAVYETRMVYYCSQRCKSIHLGSPSTKRENRRPEPVAKALPTPLASPLLREEPAPPRRTAEVETPGNRDYSAPTSPKTSSPPEPEREPVEAALERLPVEASPEGPPQPPGIEVGDSSDPVEVAEEGAVPDLEVFGGPQKKHLPFWKAQTGGYLSILAALGLGFVGISSLVSVILRPSLAYQVQFGIAIAALVCLTGNAAIALRQLSWRAAVEEWLVAIGAYLIFFAGYFAEPAPGGQPAYPPLALVAVTGIAAFVWFGRWLEGVLRRTLLSYLGLEPSGERFLDEQLESMLWGDSKVESTAGRGWAEATGAEAVDLPVEPKLRELLPQITATRGEGASATGNLAVKWSLILGLVAVPAGLLLLLAHLLWAPTAPHLYEALILAASLVIALSPRTLRRGWVAPLLTASGLGYRRRVLFRDGAAIEAAAKAQRVIFDSRGTLTWGTPKVTEILRVGDLDEERLLALAAGVEAAAGDDPLGQAIVQEATDRGIVPVPVRLARRTPGLGLSATTPDGDLLVGNRQLVLGQGISVAEADEVAAELEAEAETVVFVALADRIQGVISLRDEPRPGTETVAEELSSRSVEPVLMTGDSRTTADALGKQLGFEQVYAEIAPDQWASQVRFMRETSHGIAMVARPPRHEDTLAAADVGIAQGRRGLDMDCIGIALGEDDPTLAVKAVNLARGALKTARVNLLSAVILLLIMPGLASLFIKILPAAGIWVVPLAVTLVASVAPALFSSIFFSRPRSAG